MGLLVTK